VWKVGYLKPITVKTPPIFSCTCLFIVDAEGGFVESTLLLSSKYDLGCLNNYVFPHMEVRFFFFYQNFLDRLEQDGWTVKCSNML
jgi:hypothetical protein